MDTEKKCKHMLKDGDKCQAWALKGKEYCFSHDPESREAKLLAVAKGGQSKEILIHAPLQKIEVNTPKDVVILLAQTIGEVRSGQLDPRIASTIGYLAGHLLKAFETSELNEKVNEVKNAIAEMAEAKKSERNIYGR
jgi:hypothetical protein